MDDDHVALVIFFSNLFSSPFVLQARHHLSAAVYILDEFEKVMIKPEMTENEKSAITEEFKHRSADVNRCWAKYGLNLLADSRERLLMDDAAIQSKCTSFAYILLGGKGVGAILFDGCFLSKRTPLTKFCSSRSPSPLQIF